MKAINCEVCGSNELIKKDGVFVCQYCGTKYSLEEMKNLYSKDVVDVRVDNVDKLTNLYIIADRALESGNYEAAEECYKEILKLNPNDYRPMTYVPALYILNAKRVNKSFAGNLKQLNDGIDVWFEKILEEQDREAAVRKYSDFFYEVFLNAATSLYCYSWDEDVAIDIVSDGFGNNMEFGIKLGEFLTTNFPQESDLSKKGVEIWKQIIRNYKINYVALDKDSFYKIVSDIQKFDPEFKASHHKDDIPKPETTKNVPKPQVEQSTEGGIGSKWWFIIFMLIIFWPYGIYLLIKKLISK